MLEVRASRQPHCHRHPDEDRVASTGKLQGLLTDCWTKLSDKKYKLISALAQPGAAGHELGRENDSQISEISDGQRNSSTSLLVCAWLSLAKSVCHNFYPGGGGSCLEMIFPRLTDMTAVMNEKNIKIMAETLTLI